MSRKKPKSVETLSKEFLDREAEEYAKRVKPVVIAPEPVIENTDNTEDVEDQTESEEAEDTENTEETEETKGE